MGRLIQGVSLQPLKIIRGELGDVMHALKPRPHQVLRDPGAQVAEAAGYQYFHCHLKLGI